MKWIRGIGVYAVIVISVALGCAHLPRSGGELMAEIKFIAPLSASLIGLHRKCTAEGGITKETNSNLVGTFKAEFFVGENKSAVTRFDITMTRSDPKSSAIINYCRSVAIEKAEPHITENVSKLEEQYGKGFLDNKKFYSEGMIFPKLSGKIYGNGWIGSAALDSSE